MIELLWIKSLFHFVITLECLFFILLLIQKKKNDIIGFLLIFLTVLSISQIIGFLYYTIWIRNYIPAIPFIFRFDSTLQFAIGPLILIISTKLVKTHNKDNLPVHFIPSLLLLIITFLDQSFINNHSDLIFLFAQIHIISYCYFAIKAIEKNEVFLEVFTKIFTAFITLIAVSKSIRFIEFTSWQSLGIISEPSAWVLFIVAEILLSYGLGQMLLRIFAQNVDLEIKESNGQIPITILKQLENHLNEFLLKPEVYADPLLNVQKIADHFKVAPHHISRYLNNHLNKSFVELINSQRINACKANLEDPSQKERSIKEIYYSVGFNSKSVFYTEFKKQTGLTPGAYREKFTQEKSQL